MKDMGIVQGSREQAVELVIGTDTVYVHTDIEQTAENLFEYHEMQYDKDEYFTMVISEHAETESNLQEQITETREEISEASELMNNTMKAIFDICYPIGSCYENRITDAPPTLGTWVKDVSCSALYSAEETGEYSQGNKNNGISLNDNLTFTPNGTINDKTLTTKSATGGVPSHSHSNNLSVNSTSLTGRINDIASQSSGQGISTSGIISKDNDGGSYYGYGTSASGTRADSVYINASHLHSLSGGVSSAGSGDGSHAHSIDPHNHTFTGSEINKKLGDFLPSTTVYRYWRIA